MIKISEDEYKVGLEECKNHLYGKLILSNENSPIKLDNLRAKS